MLLLNTLVFSVVKTVKLWCHKPLFLVFALFGLSSTALYAEQPPKTFTQYCAACHLTGVSGAPKSGDAAAWTQRAKAAGGIDALIASTKKGSGYMPAMGLCMDCSDDQFKAAIEWMMKAK
jgi:cytochrome c5